jgi:D-galactose 1-dehydrogenase
MSIPVAIVGGGKIARDQHVPAIAASGDFHLAAAVTLADSELPGIPNFRTLAEMARDMPEVRAVVFCTPPRVRHRLVLEALGLELDILNEKPPAADMAQAEDIAARAKAAGRVLYQSWHSREAAAVQPAQAWLRGKQIRRMTVTWKEDVRVWHPGQEWIWEPGIGVFDPGINALSVITVLLSGLTLQQAELRFPANKEAPIAASLAYSDGMGVPVAVEFDFDQRGPQTWDIDVETDKGALKLSLGATRMAVDGVAVNVGSEPEYGALYRRFAALLAARQSDVDFSPFAHVADALAQGARVTVKPFSWND